LRRVNEVALADVTIAYDIAGDRNGEPIVLVCGCLTPALGWFGVVPMLVEAGYRVVTFDNRGVAPSSSPPAPYSVAQMAGDTLGLLDHLHIERARFVGHSMGGWIAETLAIEHPERVTAAALLGSCNVATSWEKAVTTVERDLARLDYELPNLFYALETLRYLPRAQIQDDATVDTWLALTGDNEPFPNPGRLGHYEACLAWSLDTERVKGWPGITVPILVLAFEHDIDSPPARAKEAAAQIPTARYAEIADASHLAPFSHAPDVGRVLMEFFAAT